MIEAEWGDFSALCFLLCFPLGGEDVFKLTFLEEMAATDWPENGGEFQTNMQRRNRI